jgi:tetrahydromethanopterin S-methyltransferase subunit F
LSKITNNGHQNTIQKTTIRAKTITMVNKILYRKWLFEEKHQKWSTKYYTEYDYLRKNTNNGQQNIIQKTTIWAKSQTMVNKILYRKQLFEQKHKQWSTKYYTENDYLSKNTNNGQQNTIQKTIIWAKTQTMVNKILYRKPLFEQNHNQWSTKYYTENHYLSKNTNNGQQNTIQKMTIWAKTQTMVNKILYRKWLFEQNHKQWSPKYYTENDY